MPDNYYSMDDQGGDQGGGPPHDEGKEEMEGESALLPKSILAGKEFNVGDEVVLEIVAMHDDEVEVKYAKEKKGGDGESRMADGDSEMGKAEGRLSSLGASGNRGGGPASY
jgi:hypothetical protein